MIGEKLHEGKTKIIYENTEDPSTVYMEFKDDITAGDGAKHDIIEGKAVIDWETNKNIFEYLNKCGVLTHYISSPEECVSLVKKLDHKINLEVVTRRVATGSILEWGHIAEGTYYTPPITQFHYKDDPLHDPMLDQKYIEYIIHRKGAVTYRDMVTLNVQVFHYLEYAFARQSIQLIDIKLEYGIINNLVYLIDEITGGSFRLWPYKSDVLETNGKGNILDQLDPSGRLDKDVYRMGGESDEVLGKFEVIAELTEQFAKIPKGK